jgi:hypothetical protein
MQSRSTHAAAVEVPQGDKVRDLCPPRLRNLRNIGEGVMSKKIEWYKDYFGEWERIYVDGELVFEGHESNAKLWMYILVDYFGAIVYQSVNEGGDYEKWWHKIDESVMLKKEEAQDSD